MKPTTIITNDKIYIRNCLSRDVANCIKALELMHRTASSEVYIEASFDFNNKYYKRFEKSIITTLDNRCQRGFKLRINTDNNKLYYNNIALPDELIDNAIIYITD